VKWELATCKRYGESRPSLLSYLYVEDEMKLEEQNICSCFRIQFFFKDTCPVMWTKSLLMDM
jgi:hypothetical protein